MLDEWKAHKSIRLRGIVGLYPANCVNEDYIEVYMPEDDESRASCLCKLHGIRQQAEKEDGERYFSLSDFVAPKETNIKDYVGMFVTSAGFGLEEITKKYKDSGDDYSYIMAEALADRLAEAFAEVVHMIVRKDMWGYAPDEDLSFDDLLKVRYQGIRPAPGYPSQPDHTEKKTMWDLMDVQASTGVELTESLAMLPAASVSGLYFASPMAQYFAVGKVTQEQVVDYAARKKMEVAEAEKWLRTILNYEP